MSDDDLEPLPRLLNIYVAAASHVIPQYFCANCCVNAARITIDILTAQGLHAEPVSVHAQIYNRQWMELVEVIGRFPKEEELGTWLAVGAWALGIDTDAHPDDQKRRRWPGHVVVLVDDRWVVDSAAGQFTREERGIVIPQAIAIGPATEEFLSGEGSMLATSASGEATYRICRRPDDDSFRRQPGFRKSRHNAKVRREIQSAMRQLDEALG